MAKVPPYLARAGVSHKDCARCGEYKHYDDFSPSNQRKDGAMSWCEVCRVENESRRYASNGLVREAAKARSAQWGRDNTERARVRRHHWKEHNRGRLHHYHAKVRATKKGLPFNLTVEHVQSLMDGGCCLTGIPFEWYNKKRTWNSPSLDRIDNAKGYVIGNVRAVLWCLNAAFGDWGEEAFAKVAEAYLRNRV